MRAILACVLLTLSMAGCSDEAPPAAVQPAAEPGPVASMAEESLTVGVTWHAWASVCAPVIGGAGAFVSGGDEPGRLSQPENLTSLRLEFTWTPVNPTAEHLRFFLLDGDDVAATAVGPSPLVLEVPPEAASKMEGRLEVAAQPAECPLAPANAASTQGQSVAVAATYGFLAAAGAAPAQA